MYLGLEGVVARELYGENLQCCIGRWALGAKERSQTLVRSLKFRRGFWAVELPTTGYYTHQAPASAKKNIRHSCSRLWGGGPGEMESLTYAT